jgi:hypothetical protein
VRPPSWQSLPGPVRAIGASVTRAVDAADESDRERYQRAAAEVVALPSQAVGLVTAAITRTLIEEQHPDGLESDDIQVIVARCYRSTVEWLGPAVEVRVLIAVLASALGIHEPGLTYQELSPVTAPDGDRPFQPAETITPPSGAEFAWHVPLVIADLLGAGNKRLSPYLDAAFADIAREETMELP